MSAKSTVLKVNLSIKRSSNLFDLLELFIRIFQGFSLFNYQCSLCAAVCDSSFIIPNSVPFVKNFFDLLLLVYSEVSNSMRLTNQLSYNSISFDIMQVKITYFFKLYNYTIIRCFFRQFKQFTNCFYFSFTSDYYLL